MRKSARRPVKLRPTLVQQMLIFTPIDCIFDELERDGTISVSDKGEPIFSDIDGVRYPTIPALNGWIDLWDRLALKGRFTLDLEPLRKFSNKLAYSAPLMEDDVAAAKAVINQCRKLFRGMDTRAVADVVRTQQIKIELENGGGQE